jgi:intein/homing endonuclease
VSSLATATPNGYPISCRLTETSLHISCLMEGTQVATADGKSRKIEEIKVGDHLKNHDGKGDVVVKAVNRYTQNVDELYGFNGGKPFITGEHPVLTTEGWKAIHPDKTKLKTLASVGKLKVGDKIVTDNGLLEIFSIDRQVVGGKPKVYNLSVDGGDGFIANDMVVKSFSQMQIHY